MVTASPTPGATGLDGATLDRFRAGVVEVDYDRRVERKLVDPEVLAWGWMVRKVIAKHRLERILSTRVMLDFSKQRSARAGAGGLPAVLLQRLDAG